MTAEERASLARAKRAAIIAQRAIDLLGSTQAADAWLSAPSEALDGKPPCETHLDARGARRVESALDAYARQRRPR